MRLVVKKELMPRSLKLLIYRCHLVNCIFFSVYCFWNHLLWRRISSRRRLKLKMHFQMPNAHELFVVAYIHNRGKEEIWEIHKCQNASVVPHIPQCFETFLKKSHFTNYNDFLQFTILPVLPIFGEKLEVFENLTIRTEWIQFCIQIQWDIFE